MVSRLESAGKATMDTMGSSLFDLRYVPLAAWTGMFLVCASGQMTFGTDPSLFLFAYVQE